MLKAGAEKTRTGDTGKSAAGYATAGHPARGRSGVAAGLLARRSRRIPAFPARARAS